MKWFYKVMGDEIGPLTVAELREHARSGMIDRDTLVRNEQADWVLADRVKGLLDGDAREAGKASTHQEPDKADEVRRDQRVSPTGIGDEQGQLDSRHIVPVVLAVLVLGIVIFKATSAPKRDTWTGPNVGTEPYPEDSFGNSGLGTSNLGLDASWPADGPPKPVAISNVKSFVLSQLVNPSSATFGPISCVRSRNSFRNENGSWEVKFWIEATNSFGASLRRDAYVFVDNSGDLINHPPVGSSSNPRGVLHSFDERGIDENARISKR